MGERWPKANRIEAKTWGKNPPPDSFDPKRTPLLATIILHTVNRVIVSVNEWESQWTPVALKRLRSRTGLIQREFSKLVDIGYDTIHSYELGRKRVSKESDAKLSALATRLDFENLSPIEASMKVKDIVPYGHPLRSKLAEEAAERARQGLPWKEIDPTLLQ